MAEGRKEVLCHRAIVAKRFGIVANEVPACELKAANLCQHLFSVHRPEVFLLGLVRTARKRHLPFDHRDPSVAQADLITGIDEGSRTDGRSVNQIASRHIGAIPDGGVAVARGVVRERIGPAGGVVAARGVAQ